MRVKLVIHSKYSKVRAQSFTSSLLHLVSASLIQILAVVHDSEDERDVLEEDVGTPRASRSGRQTNFRINIQHVNIAPVCLYAFVFAS